MSNPMNRRAALGRIAAASLALPAAAIAAAPTDPDAEIIALGAEIVRRAAESDLYQKRQIDPFDERLDEIKRDRSKPQAVRWDEWCAYSRESGRDAAIHELAKIDQATD